MKGIGFLFLLLLVVVLQGICILHIPHPQQNRVGRLRRAQRSEDGSVESGGQVLWTRCRAWHCHRHASR